MKSLSVCFLVLFCTAVAYSYEGNLPLSGREQPHANGGCIELDPARELTIDFDQNRDGVLSKKEEADARRWMLKHLGYVDEELIKIYK